MRLKILLILFLIVFMFTPFFATAGISSIHQSALQNYPNAGNYVPNAPYVCANQLDESNVTQVLAIAAGTPDDKMMFNTTILRADKGACVKLIMKNLSPDLVHDFVIENVIGNAGITQVDMDVLNSTSDVGFGPGINVFYFATPNVNTQFTYFCEQPGHEAAGMKGTLIVGDTGSGSFNMPSVYTIIVIILLFGLVIGFIYYNRNKNNESTLVEKKNFFNEYQGFLNSKTTQSSSCVACGHKIQPSDLFCQNCGCKIK